MSALDSHTLIVGASGAGKTVTAKDQAALPQRRRSDEPGATAGEVAAHPPRHQRILDALAWATRMLGRDAVERNIVAWFAETSPKSSGYQNDLGAMRTAGLIEYPATGMLSLTQAGGELANWPRTAPTKRDLLDAIKARLEPRFCRILDALWGISSPMNRAELAEEIGISANSSGFQNDLGKLRTLGLVDYPKSGLVELGRVFA